MRWIVTATLASKARKNAPVNQRDAVLWIASRARPRVDQRVQRDRRYRQDDREDNKRGAPAVRADEPRDERDVNNAGEAADERDDRQGAAAVPDEPCRDRREGWLIKYRRHRHTDRR